MGLVTAVVVSVSFANQIILGGTIGAAVIWIGLLVFRPRWSYRVRAGSLIATFVLTVFVTYFLVGFQGNGSLLGALAIIATVLFFGRTAVWIVLALLIAAPVLSAIGILGGIVPVPTPTESSLASVAPWVRTTIIASLIWTLIGLAVGYAVEHIEGAAAKEQVALSVLRDEQQKRAFLATISHELRTPLNGVIGMVDRLSRTTLDELQRRCVDVASSSAKLLLSVINDMLDFSKLEAGKLELERIELRIEQVLADVTSMLASSAEEKGLSLHCHSVAELQRTLIGDSNRLRQVVVNLVSNAVKFTRQGTVEIYATLEGESDESATVRIEVRDTGIGIDPGARAKLFLPFSQVDASTTRQYGGTGLGLAICRGIIDQMGGEIGVISELGTGSTFWFTVPLGKSDQAPVPPPARAGHFLLVEDSDVNAEVAGGILQMAGYTFDRARDGLAAIEALRARPYDLVLMDCHLPGLDGYDATVRIRQIEAAAELPSSERRRLPVLALTASVAQEDLDRALAAGMDDYILKPLEGARMAAKIAVHLANASTLGGRPSTASQPPRSRGVADVERALQRLQGNRALFERVVRQLVEGAAGESARLKRSVDQSDIAAVRYAVHRLRGQAAAFDAAALIAVIDDLAEVVAAKNWPAATALVDGVERELQRLVSELSRTLPASPSDITRAHESRP
jgi:signal transduction histidine kinase/CheY-like chemotaxis protein/HPt (histidine-containing phosphotransfer) domain-containing protein